MKKIFSLWLLPLGTIFLASFGAAEALVWNSTTEEIHLDRLGALSFAITSGAEAELPPPSLFQPLKRTYFGLMLDQTLWLKFEVEGSGEDFEQKLVLEAVARPGSLRVFDADTGDVIGESGTLVELDRRSVPGAAVAVGLPLRGSEKRSVLVALQSQFPLSGRINLYSSDGWLRNRAQSHLFFTAYASAIGTLIAMNLFLFLVAFKERERFYYVLMQTNLHLVLVATLMGYTIYLWPSSLRFDYIFRFFPTAIGASALTLFASEFLRLKETLPRVNRWLLEFTALTTAVIFLAIWFPASASFVGTPLLLALCLGVFVVGCVRVYQGDILARYFVVGTGSLALSNVLYLLVNQGWWSPQFLNRHPTLFLQIGYLLDAFVLAFAITQKINFEKRLRLEAEQKLSQSLDAARKSAEFANQIKTQFIRNMSHELQTPLTAICGYSELLQTSEIRTDEKRLAEGIYRGAKRLSLVVSEIVDFSHLERGRLHWKIETYSVRELIEEVINFFQPSIAQKNLATSVTFASGTPEVIVGDRFRLRQILMNLIGNSVKFTQQGAVRVVIASAPNDKIRFEIADTGVGIASDQQELVFNSFYQIDAGLTRSQGGLGLGLSLARALAKSMQGTLQIVFSEVDKGTMMALTIPSRLRSEMINQFEGTGKLT